MAQKEALNMQLMEIRKALEELEKTKEKEVYRLSGPILIKSTKAEVKSMLKDKEELINMKIKTLEKGEKKMKGKIEELRDKLTKNDSDAG